MANYNNVKFTKEGNMLTDKDIQCCLISFKRCMTLDKLFNFVVSQFPCLFNENKNHK